MVPLPNALAKSLGVVACGHPLSAVSTKWGVAAHGYWCPKAGGTSPLADGTTVSDVKNTRATRDTTSKIHERNMNRHSSNER